MFHNCHLSPENCSGSLTLTAPKESAGHTWSPTPLRQPLRLRTTHTAPPPTPPQGLLHPWGLERRHRKEEGVLPSCLALHLLILTLVNRASRASHTWEGQCDLLLAADLHAPLLFPAPSATPLPGAKQFSRRCQSRPAAVGDYFCFSSWHPFS